MGKKTDKLISFAPPCKLYILDDVTLIHGTYSFFSINCINKQILECHYSMLKSRPLRKMENINVLSTLTQCTSIISIPGKLIMCREEADIMENDGFSFYSEEYKLAF
uniref:Uncharacterized protein n=1 Tax=Cacopsylla melanoneura TaxID=428564 RepID=A0A8D9BU92_9HEMI